MIARLLVALLLAFDLGGSALAMTDLSDINTVEWSLSADTDRPSGPPGDLGDGDAECCDLETLIPPQTGLRTVSLRAGLNAPSPAPQARPLTATPLLRPPSTAL